jgi:hypothetical protein
MGIGPCIGKMLDRSADKLFLVGKNCPRSCVAKPFHPRNDPAQSKWFFACFNDLAGRRTQARQHRRCRDGTRRTAMVTALISLLGILILGSVTASFILALIKLDEIDEIS